MTDRVEPHVIDGFDAFFRDEYPKLLALGRALAPTSASDLAQEALVRACREWPKVAALDRPGAWVRRVMLNLVADDHRSRQRRRRAELRLRQQPVGLGDGVDVVVVEPADEAWFAAVRALPKRQREVVALHYIDQLPIAEVATVLGVAPGTVKQSLHRARRKLEVELSEVM